MRHLSHPVGHLPCKNSVLTEFKKYKRVFAFGCSFTCYRWPTWADLIGKQCEGAEFRNYGKSGAGNLFI